MRKLFRISLFLIAVCLMASAYTPVSAATKTTAKKTTKASSTKKKKKKKKKTLKVRKVKNQEFTSFKDIVNKKAVRVDNKKCIIQLGSSGCGYVKFKAPKTKEYKFIFASLKGEEVITKSGKKKYRNTKGYISIMIKHKYSSGSLIRGKLKTQGGINYLLNLSTVKGKSGSKKSRYLVSRYGKLKLKKGQTAYIYFNISPKASLRMRVK